MRESEIEILGLAEIRRKEERIIERKNGYMLYGGGRNGVGFTI